MSLPFSIHHMDFSMEQTSSPLPNLYASKGDKVEGKSCSRCRRHKIKCDRYRPCGKCLRVGFASECDAIRDMTTCLICKRAKLKCDRQRPCASCIRRGKEKDCIRSDGFEQFVEQSQQVSIIEPPLPLSLSMIIKDLPLPDRDQSMGLFAPFIMRISRSGYKPAMMQYMLNSMGKELRSVLHDILEAVVVLQGLQTSKRLDRVCFDELQPLATVLKIEDNLNICDVLSLDNCREAVGCWKVHWAPGANERVQIEMNAGLGKMMNKNPEELLARAGSSEWDFPSSDIEFLCLIFDDILGAMDDKIVRYHRLCRKSRTGQLEESFLVRVLSTKQRDESGKVVSTTNIVEVISPEEWDRIHTDPKQWKTYIQLREFLNNEIPTGEQLLSEHIRDQLFSEHFAAMNQSSDGRQKLARIATFFRQRFQQVIMLANKKKQAIMAAHGRGLAVQQVLG